MKTTINKTVLTLTALMSVNSVFANSLTTTPEEKVVAPKSTQKSEVKATEALPERKITDTQKSNQNTNKNDELKDKDIKWWAHDDLNYYPVPDAGLSNNVFCCANNTTQEPSLTENEMANSLPPCIEGKAMANSLPPCIEGKAMANSLPPCIEGKAMANSLPPTPEKGIATRQDIRLANSLPPTPEKGVVARQNIRLVKTTYQHTLV